VLHRKIFNLSISLWEINNWTIVLAAAWSRAGDGSHLIVAEPYVVAVLLSNPGQHSLVLHFCFSNRARTTDTSRVRLQDKRPRWVTRLTITTPSWPVCSQGNTRQDGQWLAYYQKLNFYNEMLYYIRHKNTLLMINISGRSPSNLFWAVNVLKIKKKVN